MSSGRIDGYGGGFSQDFGRRKGDADRFRRNHRLGDVVRGIFRGTETGELGWVDFEGELLLARFPGSPESLARGQMVLFLVEAVLPEISLRFYDAGQAGSRGVPLPLSAVAAQYDHAQQRIDALSASWRAAAAPAGEEAESSWAAFVAGSAEAEKAWKEIQEASAAMVRQAAPAGVRLFRSVPWLRPEANRVEMLVVAERASQRFTASACFPDGHWEVMERTIATPEASSAAVGANWLVVPPGSPDPSCLRRLLEMCRERVVPRFRCTV